MEPEVSVAPENNPTDDPSNTANARYVRPPNLPQVYINAANVAMGAFEIRIYLAEVAPTSPHNDDVTITDKICVVMSPEFARAFAGQLDKFVKSYEQSFGEIRSVPKVSISG